MNRNFLKVFSCFLIVVLLITAVSGCKGNKEDLSSQNSEEQSSQNGITPNNLPNQKTYQVLKATTAPKMDGVVSDGEYGDALAVYNYNDGLTRGGDVLSESDMKKYVSKDWTMYATYDQENIYFAITCIDEDFDTEAFTEGYQIWNGDSIEIDLWRYTNSWSDYDNENRIRYISGMAKDGTYWGGWAALHYAVVNADSYLKKELSGGKDCYAVARDGSTYTYEVKLSWKEAIGSAAPVERAFFYAQLATDSSVYFANKPGAQFWWRNVIPFNQEEQAKVDEASGLPGQYTYAFPILEFVE